MKPVIAVLALVLAGCESNPKTFEDEGTSFTGEIAGSPLVAARCVARNAEFNLRLNVRRREIPGGTGTTEVIVRANGIPILHSMWRFSKSTGGSTYQVWVDPALIDKAGHIKKVRGDC